MNKRECHHQFFETNKVVNQSNDRWDMKWRGIGPADNYGVQVICALCGERRRLMQNGEITYFDKNSSVWRLV